MKLTNEKLNELATKIAQAVAKNAGTAPELCHAPALFVLQEALQQQDRQPLENEKIFEAANEHGSGRTTTGSYLFRPDALLNFVRALRSPASMIAGPAQTTYVEFRECDSCGHTGMNDEDGWRAACNTCGWTGDAPEEDKCPDCKRTGTMSAACPKCGERYRLIASKDIASPSPALAQPVPEDGITPEDLMRSFEGCANYIQRLLDVVDKHAGGASGATERIHEYADSIKLNTAKLRAKLAASSPAMEQTVVDERMRQAIGTLRWMLNMTEDRPDATAAELFDETFTGDMKTTNRQTLEWLWAYLDPKNSRAARCQPEEEGDKV